MLRRIVDGRQRARVVDDEDREHVIAQDKVDRLQAEHQRWMQRSREAIELVAAHRGFMEATTPIIEGVRARALAIDVGLPATALVT